MVRKKICTGKGKNKKCELHTGKVIYKGKMAKIMLFEVSNKPHLLIRDYKTKNRFSIFDGNVRKVEW